MHSYAELQMPALPSQEEQRLAANGPTGTWRRSKAESLVRRSGGSADALGGHIVAGNGGGGKWGPPGAGAAAAAPMVKRPLEELVTALRKARCRDANARLFLVATTGKQKGCLRLS